MSFPRRHEPTRGLCQAAWRVTALPRYSVPSALRQASTVFAPSLRAAVLGLPVVAPPAAAPARLLRGCSRLPLVGCRCRLGSSLWPSLLVPLAQCTHGLVFLAELRSCCSKHGCQTLPTEELMLLVLAPFRLNWRASPGICNLIPSQPLQDCAEKGARKKNICIHIRTYTHIYIHIHICIHLYTHLFT